MILLIIMPAWALLWQLFSTEMVDGKPIGWMWSFQDHQLLGSIAIATLGLQVWMVVEGLMMWPKAKGVLEQPLPPLEGSASRLEASGGRSC